MNGETVGTIADVQGADAISSLLIAALDEQAIDSTVDVAIAELV